MKTELPLVLASASPRRLELLRRLGLSVRLSPVEVDESPLPGEVPLAVPRRLARAKAAKAQEAFSDLPALAGDTVVILGDRVLGKPTNAAEAEAMLLALRGRTHLVATALALRFGSREAEAVEVARVSFAPFPLSLLHWYLAGDEWRDKAGAYALQGQAAVFVAAVEGNVQAVVGLPLARLPELFARVGLELTPAGQRLTLVPRSGLPLPAPAG